MAESLLAIKQETEQAVAAKDKAVADRDAAVADLATKQAKYESDMKAALADLERVTREKTDAATAAKAKAEAERAEIMAQTEQARAALAQAEEAHPRFVKMARVEMAAIQAQLDSLRAERQAIRERVTAALQE